MRLPSFRRRDPSAGTGGQIAGGDAPLPPAPGGSATAAMEGDPPLPNLGGSWFEWPGTASGIGEQDGASVPPALGGSPTSPDAGPAPTMLSDLLKAFTDAAFQATEEVRLQHINDIQTFYELGPGGEDDTWLPKSVKLGVTPFVLPPEGRPPPLEVPLAALVQPDPLIVDELTFDFECSVLQVQDTLVVPPGESVPPGGVAISLLRDAGGGFPLRVSIRFKAGAQPLVSTRLEEALLRGVQ